jgi:hypothetical protein
MKYKLIKWCDPNMCEHCRLTGTTLRNGGVPYLCEKTNKTHSCFSGFPVWCPLPDAPENNVTQPSQEEKTQDEKHT